MLCIFMICSHTMHHACQVPHWQPNHILYICIYFDFALSMFETVLINLALNGQPSTTHGQPTWTSLSLYIYIYIYLFIKVQFLPMWDSWILPIKTIFNWPFYESISHSLITYQHYRRSSTLCQYQLVDLNQKYIINVLCLRGNSFKSKSL